MKEYGRLSLRTNKDAPTETEQAADGPSFFDLHLFLILVQVIFAKLCVIIEFI